MTWWTFCETSSSGLLPPDAQAEALERLHAGLRAVNADTPHLLDRVEQAEHLVSNEDLTPELDLDRRQLLLDTYSSVRSQIDRRGVVEQLLRHVPPWPTIGELGNG